MYRKPISVLVVLTLLLTLTACAAPTPAPKEEGQTTTFPLESPAFEEGETIPTRHTCEGENVSPELRWQDAPDNTQSYVLIMDDPDAPRGTFTHWVLFDVPPERASLPEGLESGTIGTPGKNGFGRTGYGGPCPPPGDDPHRYFFTLYALDVPELDLSSGASRSGVEEAMEGHVIGQAGIMGRYGR